MQVDCDKAQNMEILHKTWELQKDPPRARSRSMHPFLVIHLQTYSLLLLLIWFPTVHFAAFFGTQGEFKGEFKSELLLERVYLKKKLVIILCGLSVFYSRVVRCIYYPFFVCFVFFLSCNRIFLVQFLLSM